MSVPGPVTAEAALRAELEQKQAAMKPLREQLDHWPPISGDREAVQLLLAELARRRADLDARLTQARLDEVVERDRLDDLQKHNATVRDRWWTSKWAYVVLVPATCVAWSFANWLIFQVNWDIWGLRIGLSLLAVPLVVNGLRLLRASLLRRRRG